MELKLAFAEALKEIRHHKGLTQEDFATVSSRTNISLLERAKTVPTLEKLHQLCTILEVHPITLMAMSYTRRDNVSFKNLLAVVAAEHDALVSADDNEGEVI